MRVLVFDTETTGLIKTTAITHYELDLLPYIVQFSYLVYDTEKSFIEKISDNIIKIPEKAVIPEECVKIHGITKKMTLKGKDIGKCLLEFAKKYFQADVIVGHNLSFDINMVKTELMRIIQNSKEITHLLDYNKLLYSLNNPPKNKTYFCTLQNSIILCNIKTINKKTGKEFIKYPRLLELHEKLFSYSPKNLHNSLNDVIVCFRCYYMLEYDIDIVETNMYIKKMYNRML